MKQFISKEFRNALRCSDVPIHTWARKHRISASRLYKVTAGIQPVEVQDQVIRKIAGELCVPEKKLFAGIFS